MSKIKFSVIVIMYNSTLLACLMTLKSIIIQNFNDFEIIISDDGSEKQWTREIESFFKSQNFVQYKFVQSTENVGTVKNILRAIDYAEGVYLKVIGAGDLLFDENVLEHVYGEMNKEHLKCTFGEFRGYAIKNGKVKNRYFSGPICKTPYKKRNQEKIKKNMIIKGDHILGAAFFFEREYLKKLLKELTDYAKYMEDLVQVLMVLKGDEPIYLSKLLVIYEVGSGISTSKGNAEKIGADVGRFYAYALEKYTDSSVCKRVKRDKIMSSMSWLSKQLFALLYMPYIYLVGLRRSRLRFSFKKKLGILDTLGFLDEFQLKR